MARNFASLGIAALSPDNFVRILCGLGFVRSPSSGVSRSHFVLQQHRGTHQFAEALGFFSFRAVNGCGSFFGSKHAARVTLGVAHAEWNIALVHKCNDLVLRSKGEDLGRCCETWFWSDSCLHHCWTVRHTA